MKGEKIIALNKKARFKYTIEDSFEAGIVLMGTEVKSLREGGANIAEGYCIFDENGELWLQDANINPYTYGNRFNHDPVRRRKLLMHKLELFKLQQKVVERGYALVPLKMYFKDGRAKLLIGLGKGKKFGDKREDAKLRDAKIEIERELKRRK